MKYMMVISYDGSKFHGFQRQNDEKNVQGYLEDILSKVLNDNIIIKGAGRTDRGVHALGQVIHFETRKSVKGLKQKLNKLLVDCHIKSLKKVTDDFHARHSVKNKIYLYKIDLSGKRDANYYLRVYKDLDINKMRSASKLFIGYHDFKNFVAGERIDYHSKIKSIIIFKFNDVLYLMFKGIGFYRYMIRNLVGALLKVGEGKVEEDVIKEMLDNPDKEKRLTTVSPNGLYLVKIKY